MLPDNIVLAFLIIFGLRVTDVALGTIRTVFILQGRKVWATAIGLVEVTIFIYAVSQVVTGIKDNWILMFAYSGGFATGTYVGLMLEERFAMGFSQVRIISMQLGTRIAEALWEQGFGATIVEGHGKIGHVEMIFTIAARRDLDRLLKIANTIDPESFVSISDSRYLFRGYVGLQHKKK